MDVFTAFHDPRPDRCFPPTADGAPRRVLALSECVRNATRYRGRQLAATAHARTLSARQGTAAVRRRGLACLIVQLFLAITSGTLPPSSSALRRAVCRSDLSDHPVAPLFAKQGALPCSSLTLLNGLDSLLLPLSRPPFDSSGVSSKAAIPRPARLVGAIQYRLRARRVCKLTLHALCL